MEGKYAIQAVVFDWAGTVIDCGVFAPVLTFQKVFDEAGVPISEDEARGPMGVHKRIHIRKILEHPQVKKRWEAKYGTPSTAEDVEGLYEKSLTANQGILGQHCELIEGTLETMEYLRSRKIKIGSSTGYTTPVLNALKDLATKAGYTPDCYVAADEVPVGRPAPGMIFLNAIRMNVYPLYTVVKVDDTADGVLEGVNAGCWSIGIAQTGNYVGASQRELQAMDPEVLERKTQHANEQLLKAGAHYVINCVKDLPSILEDIESKLNAGIRP